jgi:hypothetical protein
MIARIRVPSILVAFTMVALFVAGCRSANELAVYREGLHQVDEPLYQAHLLLLDDAVRANLRNEADRQVVQHGVAAARGLYQSAAVK